jgi:hypothetical protein
MALGILIINDRVWSGERLKGRIATPGRIDQPNDAFTSAACDEKANNLEANKRN